MMVGGARFCVSMRLLYVAVYTFCYAEEAVISGFDWDEGNILHIQRRQFTSEEVEEVFAGNFKIRRARQKL